MIMLAKCLHILHNMSKEYLDDIFIGSGLIIWAIGIWGLSESIYLTLSFGGIQLMIYGTGIQQKSWRQNNKGK